MKLFLCENWRELLLFFLHEMNLMRKIEQNLTVIYVTVNDISLEVYTNFFVRTSYYNKLNFGGCQWIHVNNATITFFR